MKKLSKIIIRNYIFMNNVSRSILKGLILLILFTNVQSQEWEEPYFECFDDPTSLKINCTIEKITIGEEKYQFQAVLDVEEELPLPFNLVKLKYNGEAEPKIKKFIAGDNEHLGSKFQRDENNNWYININNRQDYENVTQRIYSLEIYITNENGINSTEQLIEINLKNIFDNDPEVYYIGPNPCRWRAYEANVDTNCTVRVRDPDGMVGNKITMSVKGNNNAENHFDFTPIQTSKPNEYEKDYFIRITNELDYDQSPWYNLVIYAADIANNEGHGEASFSVINIPHKPPNWIKPLVTESFLEKTKKQFNVTAISGDIGIDVLICYSLNFIEKDYSDIIEINEKNGTLTVHEIDRDARQQQIYIFEMLARKCDEPEKITPSKTVIVIEDINDHEPIITIEPKSIYIYENLVQPINITVFDVSDIDLGENAMYDVYLGSAQEAFDIIPSSGYQNASFQIVIKDKKLLDYEDEKWRTIKVEIVAQEKYNLTHKDEFSLTIDLINWNDEIPIFVKSDYSVELNETVEKGYLIENILALDRDIDDFVTYKILGSFHGIEINKNNGTVYTSEDDAFDYDIQKILIVQVEATDNLITNFTDELNPKFTQLTINVRDVNNKTPQLRMPRLIPNVTENSTEVGTITDLIKATDTDTDAKLVFEIDWESTYATKRGKEAKKSTYKDCFIIEAYPKTINEVYGHLKLNPEMKTIVDYEEYDIMYLFVIVTDLNQVINEPSSNATLTVIVDDINDCAPEFIQNTLEDSRVVMEEALGNSPAGNLILAFDRDGPGNNIITYSMSPINNTNPDWIRIDNETGALTVLENAKIDCDIPPIDGLYYEITLYDQVHKTKGNIKIKVTDINNKVPQFKEFNRTAEIYENATTDTFIRQINGYDLDRDEPHNVLEYSINFQIHKELEKFFQVDKLNGTVYVQLQEGWVLDRDHNVTEHNVQINVQDNYLDPKGGRRNLEYVSIRVVLLDVNDNAPTMPSPKDYQPKINEDAKENTTLEDKLLAEDIDQPDHPNSWVSFDILDINPGVGCKPNVEDYEKLFGIESDYKKKLGTFYTNKDLKGYYGIWKVHVLAYDHGEPQNSSTETFDLEVLPYNFHTPKILFPTDEVIRLRYDQPIDGPLLNTDKTKLRYFEAYDPDGGTFGDVSFDIITDTKYFEISSVNRSHSELVLQKNAKPDIGSYVLNIRAVDGGKLQSQIQAKIFVVNMAAYPFFEDNSFHTNFTESEIGLDEWRVIPEAKDPKNDGIINEEEKYKIYYYLDKNYKPNITEMFSLDKETRVLKPIKILNKSEGKELSIRAVASNSKEDLTGFSENSYMEIVVKVKDSNPKPVFDEVSKKYGAGVTVSDDVGKIILKVHADDSDLENSITSYHISSKIEAHGNNIESIKNDIFELKPKTGEFILRKKIETSMTGYFEFNITAEDNYENKDEANVKVYIIAESNRVFISFTNEYSVIKENENFIKDVLREQYQYEKCNIDDISNSTVANDDGSKTTFVQVRVHFIENNEAIDVEDIRRKTNQKLFQDLRNKFIKKFMYLNEIIRDSESAQLQKVESASSITLIIIAIILGILCGVLVISFVLKTRALKRQLKAFAPPEFGSRSSDLNRIGVPTTNVFSVEGSNPVINDNTLKDEFDDTSSIGSDGSDFVGINNDANFMMKNQSTSSKNSSVISQYENHKENINHKNNFENNDEKIMRF